jgi:tetratricopeptide (TPR) repeat protein
MSLSETVRELGGMGSESLTNLKPNQSTDSNTALNLQERLIEQALEIGVNLKGLFPEDPVLDQDQLKLQNELGNIVMFRGELEKAGKLFDKAQTIAQRLIESNPESTQTKRDLSLVVERQGALMEKKGRIEDALALYGQQLELLRSIAKSTGDDNPIQRDISVALRNLGKLKLRQKAIAEGRSLLESSLEISRRRANEFPESRLEQLDLITSLDDLASVYEAEGKYDQSVDCLNQSIAGIEKLIERNPENVDLQRRYAILLGHFGDMEFRRKSLESAEVAQRKALTIRERLATKDPDNVVIQRELNVSYSNLGEVLVGKGDLNQAETLFRKGIEVVERLKNGTGTQDADLMRSLSVANNKMGFLLLKKGQNTESLDWYQRGLAVIEELANRNPGDARTQRDLEISLTRVGDLQQQLGETQEARGYYERSLKSSLARVASNPEDVEAIKDLIASRNRMASAFALSGEIPEAIAEYHAALDLQSQLEKKTGLPDLKLTRAKLLRGLGFTAMMLPDLKSARASFEESLVILNDLRNDKKLSPNDALLMKGVQEGIDGITQIEFALGDLEEILKESARRRKESLLVRCVEMARHGRIAESQQAIDRLRSGGYFLTPDDLYELVRAYGLIARSIVKESISLPEAEKKQHREALHTGIETLRQAIELGFYNLPLLKMDKDLGQFSTDAEFKKLLEALSVRPGPDGSWDALMQQPAASQPHLLKGRLEMMAAQRMPKDLVQAAGKLEELSKLAESSEEKMDGFYEAFRGYAFAIKLMAGWKGQVDFQVPETLREPTGRDAEIQAVITSAQGALQAALALGFEDYERFGSDENLSVVRQLPEFKDVMSSVK